MTGRPSRLRAGLLVPADLAVGADDVAGVVVDGEPGQVERGVVAGLEAGVGR
jgi:hypothetical protein